MAYGPAYPHDPIEEILPDVFMVRGAVRFNPLMRISRNMAIVRHEGELTRLRELGSVKRLLRLNPLHGLDDRYYVDSFQAELWALAKSETHPEPGIDHYLTAEFLLVPPDVPGDAIWPPLQALLVGGGVVEASYNPSWTYLVLDLDDQPPHRRFLASQLVTRKESRSRFRFRPASVNCELGSG